MMDLGLSKNRVLHNTWLVSRHEAGGDLTDRQTGQTGQGRERERGRVKNRQKETEREMKKEEESQKLRNREGRK